MLVSFKLLCDHMCNVILQILLVYFTYPDTKSIILEEISIVFDEERIRRMLASKTSQIGLLGELFMP